MAKVEVKMPEEFLLKLSRLGERTDEIIPKVLEAGGEVVLSKVKSNLQSVIGSGRTREVFLLSLNYFAGILYIVFNGWYHWGVNVLKQIVAFGYVGK